MRILDLRAIAFALMTGAACAGEKPPLYHKILPNGELRYIYPPRHNEVGLDYVTPHIPWGRPLVGGPVKALVIANRYDHRQTVELAQRLSLDYETVMIRSRCWAKCAKNWPAVTT